MEPTAIEQLDAARRAEMVREIRQWLRTGVTMPPAIPIEDLEPPAD
jgi:hypothetical protein